MSDISGQKSVMLQTAKFVYIPDKARRLIQ